MSLFRLPKLRRIASRIEGVRDRFVRRGRRSGGDSKFRRLLVDPLEERVLLSLAPGHVADVLVNQEVSDAQFTLAAQSIAVDHDGDFVVAWTRYDDVFQLDPVTGDPILDPITGLPMPVIDPETGVALSDANIYARYFTDEVQRLTLPDEAAADNVGGRYGSFSLVYGGNEVQKLEITATYEPYVSGSMSGSFTFQQLLAGQFKLGFDLNGNGSISETDPIETVTINFNELEPLEDIVATIQTGLQGLGGALADVTVQAINPHEYLIHFGNAANGEDQPEMTVESFNFYSGFLPAVMVSTVREPVELGPIPVSPNNPALTALSIEQAFLQTSENFLIGPIDFPPTDRVPLPGGPYYAPEAMRSALPRVTVTPRCLTEFDIRFGADVNTPPTLYMKFAADSSKKDHPELAVSAVADDWGNTQTVVEDEHGNPVTVSLVSLANVETLKEPSPEFRVNAEEPDNPATILPDKYNQINPAVAMDADGEFVIVWEGEVPDWMNYGSVTDIFARRFTAAGLRDPAEVELVQGIRPLGDEFCVNQSTTNAQGEPAVGMDDAGNFVIAWAGQGQDLSFFNSIFAQQFTRHGERLAPEWLVNTEDTAIHFEPYAGMSADGHFAITWTRTDDPNIIVPSGYVSAVQAVVYDPAGNVLMPQFVVGGAGSSSVAFDMANNFVVAWDEDSDQDNIPITSMGVRAQMYELYDSTGQVSGTIIRSEFRANSATLNPGGDAPLWPTDQWDPQVVVDADGDLMISFDGFGPDVSETVDSLFDFSGTFDQYLMDQINPNNNADLLPFFDPLFEGLPVYYFYYNYYPDVDNAIEEVLIRAIGLGATDAQLGRLRAILDKAAGLVRGEANGVMFSRWDADPRIGTLNNLFSDSVANAQRDGHNQRFMIILDDTVNSGSFDLRVFHPYVLGWEDVTVNIALQNNVFDPFGTADNINAALEGAARTGINWPEAPNWWLGPVEVRVVNYPFLWTEILDRMGTPWEIPFADVDDYVFEVTFQGEVHDEPMYIYDRNDNLSTGAVDEQQILSFSPLGPLPLQGDFTVSDGTNTSGAITFDSNNLFATAAAIQNALVNDLNMDGAVVTPLFGGPPYLFQIDFAGNSAGTDQPQISLGAEGAAGDVPPPLNAQMAAATTQEGGTQDAPPPITIQHTFGLEGTLQTAASIGMEPDGDFVMAWTQYDTYTDSVISNNNIYVRTFNENTDTAGPQVTDVVAPDGTLVDNGGVFPTTSGLQYIVLVFDEEMLVVPDVAAQLAILGIDPEDASDQLLQQLQQNFDDSVTNPSNYHLLQSGSLVSGAVVNVEFGMNLAADMAEEYGLNPVPTNKWEAIITVDADSATPGLQPFPAGTYTIEVLHPIPASLTTSGQSGVRDKARNPLGHTGFQVGGADFSQTFKVMVGEGPGSPGDPDPGLVDDPVNPTEIGAQNSPSVAIDASGDYVVVWASYGQGADAVTEGDIIAQRFNLRGEAQGPEFVINDYQMGSQIDPDVAMDNRGNFVVTWSGAGPVDNSGVFARRFDLFGRPLGNQFRVNQYRQSIQDVPRVAMDADGDFVVSWTSYGQDGDRDGAYARRYNALGQAAGDEFRVNTTWVNRQENSDVAMDAAGNFVALWSSDGQDESSWGVFGKRYNAAGQPLGGEFRVNVIGDDKQIDPQVSMDEDGDFVVTWASFSNERTGSGVRTGYDIYARRYNAAGVPQEAVEFLVNETTDHWQVTPAVGMDKDGNFTVVWSSFDQDNEDFRDYGIYARMYLNDGSDFIGAGSGSPLGEFRVNATTVGDQVTPAVARNTDSGDYVVVWVGPDSDLTGIYSRILDPPVQSPVDPGGGDDPDPTTLTLTGTPGNDVFRFVAAATPGAWVVKLNNVAQYVGPQTIAVSFDGRGGSDTAVLIGTAGDETVELRPGQGTFHGGSYTVTVADVESISVEGLGGEDEATFYDSEENDTFVAKPGYASLTTPGGSNTATGFETASAYATAGGYDVAKLHDSTGNDLFVTGPQHGELSGDGFSWQADGFEAIHAYATAGGRDVAKLFDSTGDDIFNANPIEAVLYNGESYNRAKFFESVHAYATAGGRDVAKLFDSSGNDIFVGTPVEAALYGDGYYNRAKFFESVHAYATAGGRDVAKLFDSTGNDIFAGTPVEAALYGDGYYNRAKFFEEVRADGSAGGSDQAQLSGSAGNDMFLARPGYAELYGTGFHNQATHFETVKGDASSGGFDVAKLFDSPANDSYLARPGYAELYGAGFRNQAAQFDQVHAYATSGGYDVAKLFDSVGGDTFVGTSIDAALYGTGFYNRAKFFEGVHAYATADGIDVAHLYGSTKDDTFVGTSVDGALYGTGFYNRAKFFEELHAHAGGGGIDTAILYDAVLDLGLTKRDIDGPGAEFAKVAWLYEFEKCFLGSKSSDDDPAPQVVDEFLTAYWP